jgi:cupin fold WbuC family metalloprotein
MKWTKQSEDVFYPKKQEFVEIGKNDIDNLRRVACSNPRQRARYCTHTSVDDEIHEMIIYHKKGIYIRPHKHIGKTESFHLIDGEADVIIFDEGGNVETVLRLGDYESGKSFYYRVPESVYHSQIFKQNTLFHEATKGPFDKNDTVFPIWAPTEDENILVNAYLKKLNFQLEAYFYEYEYGQQENTRG